MSILCISASNALNKPSVSDDICGFIADIAGNTEIVKLRESDIRPCVDCGLCYDSKRCPHDEPFNQLYASVIQSDAVFIVSPHYAPIPAKLCMLLEKMEEVAFVRFIKDNSYKAEVYGIPCGVISHGGTGEDWAKKVYKAAVNDPIANALQTIQLSLIPYDDEWDTGIVVPAQDIKDAEDHETAKADAIQRVISILRPYVEKVIKAKRSETS